MQNEKPLIKSRAPIDSEIREFNAHVIDEFLEEFPERKEKLEALIRSGRIKVI